MDELSIARLAVERGALASGHLDECLRWQQSLAAQGSPPSLLALLQQRGLLSPDAIAAFAREAGAGYGRPGNGHPGRGNGNGNGGGPPPAFPPPVGYPPRPSGSTPPHLFPTGGTPPGLHQPPSAPTAAFSPHAPASQMRGSAVPGAMPGMAPSSSRNPAVPGFDSSGQHRGIGSGRHGSPGMTPGSGGAPTTSSALRLALQPGQRLDRYEIQRILGRGGMGIVYLARDVAIDRLVALKTLLVTDQGDQRRTERFIKEAKAAARLHHPNLVAIHDVGDHEGCPYFTMDYIDGQSLTELIHKTDSTRPADPTVADGPGGPGASRRVVAPRRKGKGGIPGERAAAILRDVSRGIQHAHKAGIIHRDIKPQNVLLDTAGKPYIMDFGLAKELGESKGMTQPGQVMGTPAYMAPEQARNSHKANEQSDVYSLGAILYECLCGAPPFEGSTPYNVLSKVMQEDPIPPTERNSNVPEELERVCLKALEKDPAARYASADALADDLDRFLRGDEVAAKAQRRGSIGKGARRVLSSRLGAIAALLLLAAASVLGGWGVIRWQRWSAKRAEEAAARLAAEEAAAAERERQAAEERAKQVLADQKKALEEKLAGLRADALGTKDSERRLELQEEIVATAPTAVSHLDRARAYIQRARELPRRDARSNWEAALEDLQLVLDKASPPPDEVDADGAAAAALRARVIRAYVLSQELERADQARADLVQVRRDAKERSWEADVAGALERLDAKDRTGALGFLDRILPKSPDQAIVLWLRSALRITDGNIGGALRDLDKAIELAPRWAAAWARRASCRAATNDAASFESDVNRALQIDPQNLEALLVRGSFYVNNKDYQRALPDLDAVLAIKPNELVALRQRAAARLYAGDAAGSAEDADRLCQLRPSDPTLQQNRGLTHLVLGRSPQTAKAALDVVCRLKPARDPFLLRVLANELLGDIAAARKDLQVIEQNERQPAGPMLQGIWQQINQLRALSRIGPLPTPRSIQQGPPPDPIKTDDPPVDPPKTDDPPTTVQIRTTVTQADMQAAQAAEQRRDVQGALRVWDTILAREPNDPIARLHRARMRFMTRQLPGCIEDADVAAKNLPAPFNAEAILWKSRSLTVMNRFPEAHAILAELLKDKPGDPNLIGERAQIYTMAKEWEKALADWNVVISAATQPSPALIERGRCYRFLGKKQEAITDLEAFLATNPPEPFRSMATQVLTEARQLP